MSKQHRAIDRCVERDSSGLKVTTPAGRSLSVEPTAAGERVTVTAADGALELAIELTPEGPRLLLRAVSLAIEARDAISVRAGGALRLDAPEVSVTATRGDLRLRASDSLRAHGERVLLNCDDPAPLPRWMEDALGARVRTSPRGPRRG